MRRAWLALAIAAAAILGGGALFAVVEGVPFTSGAYWALVTASTVGYGDVIAHKTAGRIITAVVILTAIPALARLQSVHIRSHMSADLDAIQASADKALRIAADTYRHHTGEDHPDAPPPKE